MKKKIVFLGCVLLLGGCANASGASQSSEASGSEQTFENYGREVVVAQQPTEVITMGPNTSELFCALGLEELIVGNTLDNHSRGALPEFEEAYAQIPELTYGSATREAVLTSGADFIYGIDWDFGSEGLSIEELEGAGITVYQNAASSIEEVYQEIRDIGQIFEVEAVAEDFITDQQARIEAVKEQAASEPVRVLVYDSGDSGVFTASGSNFESLLIEEAGGENIFSDLTEAQWVTVSTEEVLARDPEVIVVHDYDTPSAQEKIATIKEDPVLSEMTAVKENRFVTVALESVLTGPRMAYVVEELAAEFNKG